MRHCGMTPLWVGSSLLPAAMTEQVAKRTRGAQFRGSKWIEKAVNALAHLRVRINRFLTFLGAGSVARMVCLSKKNLNGQPKLTLQTFKVFPEKSA